MEYRRYAWAEIDTAAIARNVRTLKALTPPGTRFMAVVKADGYGHGSLPAAKAALGAGAHRLGVATLEEAVVLREGGVSAPIHLLSEPPADGIDIVIENRLVPAVTTREFAVDLSRAALVAGATVPYHLKIDSGMNRIGVRAEDAFDVAAWLKGLPGVEMEGAFTHFATADVPGDWEFERQLEKFRSALGKMQTERVRPAMIHSANSAATILHPETHFDMVRCGIAIYGLHPADTTYGRIDLVPAMSVKSRVSYVKRIGLGDGVSYGFTYHAAAPTTIATVPMGYADGVHRVLSNTMEVLIGGRRCRQVGRICMDQFMVEIPEGLRVEAGDEVVLVGEQGGERLGMDGLAAAAQTINYELACGFALRLGRRYR
ncbi:MAG: alanine racemase [Coriobacteriia bacterium]